MNSIIKSKKTYYTLGILFVFVCWGILSVSIKNDFVVPSINLTLKALGNLFIDPYTYKVLGHTLLRLLTSISISFILGVMMAILSNLSVRFKAFIKPMIVLFKTLPIVVVIIMLLIMFTKEYASIFIVTIVVFPIIYEATLAGLENVDSNIKDEIKMLSNNNLTIVRKIYLPLTIPYIITSLIQSIGLGLKVLVMAEYISQPLYSIGKELVYYKNDISSEYVYAWSIILIIFVLIIEILIVKSEKD